MCEQKVNFSNEYYNKKVLIFFSFWCKIYVYCLCYCFGCIISYHLFSPAFRGEDFLRDCVTALRGFYRNLIAALINQMERRCSDNEKI